MKLAIESSHSRSLIPRFVAPDIAEPIRKILGRYPSVHVLFGDVSEIDTRARILMLANGTTVQYDLLALATGSQPFYFGQESWGGCPGLKTIEDARTIRSRLLLPFEHAERTTDPVEQSPADDDRHHRRRVDGVELAPSIAELSRYTLARDFRNIRPEKTRIILVDAGNRLLAGFAPELSEYARMRLVRLGVEIALGNRVEAIEAHQITVGGQRHPGSLDALGRRGGGFPPWLPSLVSESTAAAR